VLRIFLQHTLVHDCAKAANRNRAFLNMLEHVI
jgi:hypothetical protein